MPPRRRAVHGARLDPTGYLRHDPDDAPVVASTWIGEPTGEGVVVDFTDDAAGVNVKYGEDKLTVGDVVFLTPDEIGEACEICIIKALYSVDDEEQPKRMTTQWFWRPESLEQDGAKVTADERELFLSNTEDAHNSVDAIE
eukprot:4810338-Prymnesium_polylepis.1